MKAMVFAAGIGSRLRPFTDTHPKALAPVAGIPALVRVLVRLRDSGVGRVVVNVHHFASQVCGFIADNDGFGMDISISDETGRLLDTGGGLLKASPLLLDGDEEPILLHNADIVTDISLGEMLEAHEYAGSDATLLVSGRKSSRQLYFDKEDSLCGWSNLKTGQKVPDGLQTERFRSAAFGGVHIVSPKVVRMLDAYARKTGTDIFSIVPFYLDAMSELKIKGFTPTHPYRWHDIGTPDRLAAASAAFQQ